MHRLIKQGTVPVEIRETTADGELALQWKVSHDSEYGQPGPLAYKTDTLVVNRGLELAGRPVPEILRLGSLREIAEATGTGEGDDEEGWPTIGQQGSGRSCLSVQYRLTREDFGPTTD